MKIALASVLLTIATTAPLAAQSVSDFPNKPMTYIIPFSPGGESDISSRFQQSEWEDVTGEQVIIQYQPGAGGAQAWSQLNSLPGDGYSIMQIIMPHTVLQPLTGSAGYETKDLTPVNYFHYTPDAIFVRKESQFTTLKQLVDYAEANPGLITFAGSGSNSSNNLAAIRFDEQAGVTTTYVPFSGSGPSITAVLGGSTMAGFNYATSGVSQGDALRMLAVASAERLPAFPDVPTFKELGYDIVGGAYRGVAVPAATPEDLRQRISDIVSEINRQPDFIEKMEDAGFVLIDIGYDKVPEFVAARIEEYTAGAKALGLVK
ncbi:tripartite tricarboxylate transporter substrate binding protein [Manganibacter manganicus]|uniref:C4-dicarboxylate ABC transporter substrate-binding protein n=1 Tax=Manganibacter manganicus TaxID=1873176 RepID=A0A1V8RUQ0_9HYPH|nr:tripartite tricarboxylate transporter substrate binding protein [Pseudaminobacter manganicus]OQM76749.1 C4-dicarboxylate ABC transporter substrate-binding protein [Pseudaminobacter manganicus]